jgi:small subunit ribosomal protein S15
MLNFLAWHSILSFYSARNINLGRPGHHALGPSHTTMSTNAPTTTVNTKEYQLHEGDTGSAPYQVALLTQRIFDLTDHLNIHTKDFSSRRGLLKLVARRRKLLDYIKTGSEEKYQEIIKGLGLRR